MTVDTRPIELDLSDAIHALEKSDWARARERLNSSVHYIADHPSNESVGQQLLERIGQVLSTVDLRAKAESASVPKALQAPRKLEQAAIGFGKELK